MEIIIHIDDEHFKKLHRLSMRQGIMFQDIIEEAISGYLEKHWALHQSPEK